MQRARAPRARFGAMPIVTEPSETPRPSETPLKQAERYGGPASDGAGGKPEGLSVKSAVVGGVAMIATTAILRLVGAAPWLAAILGIGVFVAVVILWRRREKAEAARPATRVAATAPGVDAPRVTAELAEAEARLTAIDAAADGLSDRGLDAPLRAMTAKARRVLDIVAKDPRDRDRARKFFVVYLPSAEAAVRKFTALGVRDDALDARFRTLVAEMDATVERQIDALMRDDKLDLEVEMEVLADRLRQDV